MITYSTLFGNLGKVIAAVNEVDPIIEGLAYDLTVIQDSFEAAEQQDALAPAIGISDSAQQSLVNYRQSLGQIADLRLTDYSTVISQLNLATNDVNSVLSAMFSDMVLNTQSVDASTVTLGSVTAAAANVGNGTVLIDTTLDGVSSPIQGGMSHPGYVGRLSELAVNETMVIKVTADSYADGRMAGQESLSINGGQSLASAWSYGTEGSGTGPGLTTLQAGTVLSNQGFETFSVTNTPDSWTIATGTVTTNVAQETAGANVYLGSSSVKFIGTGVASISITQSVSASRVKPLQRYCFSIRYKMSGVGGGGVTFVCKLTGTGYTEGATEKISIAGGAYPTSWTLGYFYVNMPAVIPSDFKMSIALTGTPAINAYFDSVGFAPVTWHGGINFVAIAGATPFVKGDAWTASITSNEEGTINQWFRRNYRCQLPSSTTGAETISDSLAE